MAFPLPFISTSRGRLGDTRPLSLRSSSLLLPSNSSNRVFDLPDCWEGLAISGLGRATGEDCESIGSEDKPPNILGYGFVYVECFGCRGGGEAGGDELIVIGSATFFAGPGAVDEDFEPPGGLGLSVAAVSFVDVVDVNLEAFPLVGSLEVLRPGLTLSLDAEVEFPFRGAVNIGLARPGAKYRYRRTWELYFFIRREQAYDRSPCGCHDAGDGLERSRFLTRRMINLSYPGILQHNQKPVCLLPLEPMPSLSS